MTLIRRTSISAVVLALLVSGLSVVTSSPAGAAQVPWNWVVTRASVTPATSHFDVTARCADGYRPVTGGFSSDDYVVITGVHITSQSYRVSVLDLHTAPLSKTTVRVWCARTDQVDVQVSDRRLVTATPDEGIGEGTNDFACDGDRTPVDAAFDPSADLQYIRQSGAETVNGTNRWFVEAVGNTTSAYVDVHLQCIANVDLAGAAWHTQSSTPGNSPTYKTITSTCPAGQRLVTGGGHVDSIFGELNSSAPASSQSWTTRAYVPANDTLSVAVLCVPAGDPVAVITSGPRQRGASIATTTATFTFTAYDPSGGTAHNYCFLNTSGLGPCSGSYTVTGLSEGQNVFSIEAYTDDGRGWASTEQDYYFWVDLTAPTLTVKEPASFTLGKTARLRAVGADNQALDGYENSVVTRRASGAGARTAAPVTRIYVDARGTLSLPVKAGMSYRISTRVFDRADNVSRTLTASTAVPLDNRALTASRHWSLHKGKAYTNGIVSRTRTKGATLKHVLYGTTLGIVSTTCKTCGKIGVYVGKKLVKKINLHARTTHHRHLSVIHIGHTPVQAKVTIKVLTRHKRVEIDGLGAVV